MAKGEWHAHRDSLGPQRRVCQWSVVESGRSMHVRFCRRWQKNSNVSRQVPFFLFFSPLSFRVIYSVPNFYLKRQKMVERRNNDECKTENQQSIDPAAIQQWWQIIIWVLCKHEYHWALKSNEISPSLSIFPSQLPCLILLSSFPPCEAPQYAWRKAGRQQNKQITSTYFWGA